MNKLNKKRRGIPFLADFYAANLLWNKEHRGSTLFYRELLLHTRRILLRDVGYAVVGELRHCDSPVGERFRDGSTLYNRLTVGEKYARRAALIRMNGGPKYFFCMAQSLFRDTKLWEWDLDYCYGGEPWGLICDRADLLANFSADNLSHLSVAIDMLVDSCHNSGYCLNKLYPDIEEFLGKKTESVDASWLIYIAQKPIQQMQKVRWEFGPWKGSNLVG